MILTAAGAAIIGRMIGYVIGREFGYWLLLRYGGYLWITESKIKLGLWGVVLTPVLVASQHAVWQNET